MIIRFFKYFFIIYILFFHSLVFADSFLSSADKQQITNKLDTLVQGINGGDVQGIVSLIAPDDLVLRGEISDGIKGRVPYKLNYDPYFNNAEFNDNNEVLISVPFTASGTNWSISGHDANFIFQKRNNQWEIKETDFHYKLRPEYTTLTVTFLSFYMFTLLLGFLILWIWMFIDCLFRDFENKTRWILLFIFFAFFAPLLYLAIIKRANTSRKPLSYNL